MRAKSHEAPEHAQSLAGGRWQGGVRTAGVQAAGSPPARAPGQVLGHEQRGAGLQRQRDRVGRPAVHADQAARRGPRSKPWQAACGGAFAVVQSPSLCNNLCVPLLFCRR